MRKKDSCVTCKRIFNVMSLSKWGECYYCRRKNFTVIRSPIVTSLKDIEDRIYLGKTQPNGRIVFSLPSLMEGVAFKIKIIGYGEEDG